MKNNRPRVTRAAVVLGIAGSTVVAGILLPATADAAVGKDPGHLTLTPGSGTMSGPAPTWATDTACAAPFTNSAKLELVEDSGTAIAISGTVSPVTAAFSGTMQVSTLAQAVPVAHLVNGHTYEFVVMCQDASLNQDPEQSSFLTISADGSTYTTSATPPASTVSTTTSLTASPNTVTVGGNVTLTASVVSNDTAKNDAVGQVEFFSGTTSLGKVAVAGGAATLTTSSLPVGSDSVTAQFEPTDPTKFTGSTSTAATVTVNATPPGTGQETINVGVSAVSSGSLTLTVSSTPVTMTTPKNIGTALDSTGALSPVSVSDSRQPSQPGWDLTGSASDFAAGANTFTGNALGWTPAISTPNTANDVTAGAAVTANSPGLKTAAPLASAAVGKGAGTTVLGGALDLQIPFSTPAGSYSSTMTITLISK
jgi:hypothetical protein